MEIKKEIGKLYSSGTLVVMCTGKGKSEKRFSGVVVEQINKYSDHQIGNYSETWTWHPNTFKEHKNIVKIDNCNYHERVKIGETNKDNCGQRNGNKN